MQYEAAIDLYVKGLRLVRGLREAQQLAAQSPAGAGPPDNTTAALLAAAPATIEEEALLYSNRSAAFASLARQYLSRPAARSERFGALFGLDPKHLAALALADAQKVGGAVLWG